MSRSVRKASLAVAILVFAPAEARPAEARPADPAPDLPDYIEEALSPFRSPPDSAEVAGLLSRWRRDGGLVDPHERVLGARLWRRAGHAQASLDLLGSLPEDGPLRPLARLERARIGFELPDAETGWRHRAASDWLAACEAMRDGGDNDVGELREALWADLKILATPEEHDAWAATPDEQACRWLRDLIDERARRMAVSSDERLARHYERIRIAREYFYLDRPRFYVGMTHWHGRREGEWMDDRGLIYVRMGPPDVAEACGAVFPFDADPFAGDLLATCWVYDRPEGYKLYYFSTKDKVTERVSADGDYYLQETLGPRAFPGDPYFQKYVRNADLPRALTRHLQFSRRLGVSGDDFDAGLDRAEAQAYRQVMRVATREFADEALIEVPDVPAVRGADMLWESLRFLNPADGRWQVWVVASIPAGQLTARRFAPVDDESAQTWEYAARSRLATGVPGDLRLDSAFNRAVVERELPPDAGLPVRTFFVAEPGPMPITLVVEDAARPGLGAWAQDTVHVPEVLPLPTVSDIAVGQRDDGNWTRDGVNFLRVSPDHVTNPDGSLHVYFEVYGVRRLADYAVELRIGTGLDPAGSFERDPSTVPFRLGFDAAMPYDRVGRHALKLDLSGTPAGTYSLAVQIRDTSTGTRSLPAVTPVVVAD